MSAPSQRESSSNQGEGPQQEATSIGLPNVQASSLAEKAYFEIRNRILNGSLPFGTILARRDLAQQLGVSVPPVTEALQRLEQEGLVESKARAGTRVRIPTRKDIEDHGHIREALESQAALLFSHRASSDEREKLVQLGKDLDTKLADSSLRQSDKAHLFALNIEHMSLHLYIAECARCAPLKRMIETEQVLIFNCLHGMALDGQAHSANAHEILADKVANGNVAEVDIATRDHIRTGLAKVLHLLPTLDTEDTERSWRKKTSP